VLDLLCEGPIEGFANGNDNPQKSIYLDGVPLMNPDGTTNYTLKDFEYRRGSTLNELKSNPVGDSTNIGNFPTVEAELSVGEKLEKNADGTPLYKTAVVQGGTTNRIRVTFSIPSLYEYKSNGDLVGYSSSYAYQILKGDGSVVLDSGTKTIEGKTSSKFTWSFVHDLPAANYSNNYVVKAWRVTPQETGTKKTDTVYFDSLTCITTIKLFYPNSAIVGLKINSEYFNSIPTRGYLMKLLQVKIPHNYDPISRTYTGLWDGTVTKVAWTDNPAWCFYDLLTNERYGLGSYIDANQIDLASLYEIAQKCDELVPDPYNPGQLERRFSLNAYIQTKEDAVQVLQNLASAFRGMVFWSTGLISCIQDAVVQDPIMQFTNANVLNGKFTYAGGSRKVKHNAALITWNDPMLDYKQRIEYVTLDDTAITKYGYNPIETVAMGCTSRGQAHRLGKWLLYTDTYESNAVSFKAALDSAYLRPGMVIRVLDNIRAGGKQFKLAGRVLSRTANTITLDRDVIIEAGKTYKISCNNLSTSANSTSTNHPTVVEHDTSRLSVKSYSVIAPPGTTNILTLGESLDEGIAAGSIWVLNRADLTPEEYKVISIKDTDTVGVFEINAIAYDKDKYAYIEENVTLPANNYTVSNLVPNPINAIPSSGYGMEFSQNGTVLTIASSYASLFRPGDIIGVTGVLADSNDMLYNQIAYYTVASISGDSIITNPGNITTILQGSGYIYSKNIVIRDDIYIEATGKSIKTKLNFSLPSNLNTTGYSITTQYYSFTSPTSYTLTSSNTYATNTRELSHEILGVQDNTGFRIIVTPFNSLGKKGPTLVYPPTNLPPYLIRGKTVAPANITGVTYSLSGEGTTLTWDACTDLDFKHYEVRIGTASSFDDITDTADKFITVGNKLTYTDSLKNYNVFIKAVDTSDICSRTAANLSVAISTPQAPSALTAALVDSTFELAWVPPVISNGYPIDHYEIYHTSLATNNLITTTPNTNYSGSVNWLGSRAFFVRAVSSRLEYTDAVGEETSAALLVEVPQPPVASTITGRITGSTATITWTDNKAPNTLGASGYIVKFNNITYEVPASPGTLNNSVIVTLPPNTLGDLSVEIQKVDTNTPNYTSSSVLKTGVITLAPPGLVEGFNLIIEGAQYKASWSALTNTIPIDYYEVGYYEGDNAISIGKAYTTFILKDVDWGGTRSFWVRAYDVLGNCSGKKNSTLTIELPSAPTIREVSVIDNNVLLYWNENAVSTTQLPIVSYYLRKKYIKEGVEVFSILGEKSGGFTTVIETASNVYTYELAAIDTARNLSSYTSRSATVNQPPDYILRADRDTKFSVDTDSVLGSSVGATFVDSYNIMVDSDGTRLMPVNPTESWQDHFINHNWSTIQDALDDQQFIYASPGTTSAFYEEVIDYKTVIPSSKVTITPTKTIVSGNPAYNCDLYTALGKEYTITVTGGNTFTLLTSTSGTAAGTLCILNKNLSGEYTRGGNVVTITTLTPHNLSTGEVVVLDFINGALHGTVDDTIWTEFLNSTSAYSSNFRFVKYTLSSSSAKLGTYNILSESPIITVSCPHHGLVAGDTVLLDFIDGNAQNSSDNSYTISTVATDTFTVVSSVVEGFSSGNVHVYNPKFSGLIDLASVNVKLDSKLKTITGTLTPRVPLTATSFSQTANNIVINMPNNNHNLSVDDIIDLSMYTGTYSQVGTTITVTCPHSLAINELVILDFSSGGAKDNVYKIASTTSGSFTVNTELNLTTSGSVSVSKGIKLTGVAGSELYAKDTVSITRNISSPTIDINGSLVFVTSDKTISSTPEFIDIDAIVLSANSTQAITAVYDYVDAAKPGFFRVLLFNAAGTRVSASCSYTVRGF
jgi:hypothetical protein